jgi:RNA polymerase sigma-70 factor (ECF subfamily)
MGGSISETSFAEFLSRIRSGDESAAEELVRLYEPLIRREVRLRLEDDRLRRAFDSLDVCQSVFASFFTRASSGEFDLQQREHLVRLLVTMARNKLASSARREHRQRRDHRRLVMTDNVALEKLPGTAPAPGQALEQREVWERLQECLTDDERRIAELRGDGVGWDEIACQLGGNGHARRMQFRRGLQRARSSAGFESDC